MAGGAARLSALAAGILGSAAQVPAEVFAKLPLAFEANWGQSDPHVDFLLHGRGYTLFLTPTEADLALASPAAVRMKLAGGNPHAARRGLGRQPGTVNYFLGSDPAKWRCKIPTFAKVEYQAVYPGVDLVYHGNRRELEYDFVIAPRADPGAITLEFEGANGLAIDAGGNLLLRTSDGSSVQLHKPVVYQELHGEQRDVPGRYLLVGVNRVGFQIGAYDLARPLVIDPVLVFSTRLGNDSGGYAIALDPLGNVYVTGDTTSSDFPLAKPLQRAAGGSINAFVAKLSSDGSKLLYSTYLGGRGADVGYGIAVDAAGNAYVTGDTSSPDFPLANPVQRVLGGEADVFVAKLSADGSRLIYSTYLGGKNGERGLGIAVDPSGSSYVTGYTHSADFPTVNPLQPAFAGGNADAFVFKLNPAGTALVYSTFLGGGNDRPDIGTAIAADAVGNAYVTGMTNSRDFPTLKPIQPFRGPTDAFVTKLNPNGSALVYSTHLGGGADDEAMGIAVDAAGSAYVTGHTESLDFPTTPGAFSTSCVAVPVNIPIGNICSGGDAFVSKLSPDGSALVYSTYLNGSRFEVGRGIAVDAAGSAYVTGLTSSPDFPTVHALQKVFGGAEFDAFLVKLNPGGSGLVYATYLGGVGDDLGYGVAVDRAGNAWVTGVTESRDFPSRKPLRRSTRQGGLRTAFVVRIADQKSSP